MENNYQKLRETLANGDLENALKDARSIISNDFYDILVQLANRFQVLKLERIRGLNKNLFEYNKIVSDFLELIKIDEENMIRSSGEGIELSAQQNKTFKTKTIKIFLASSSELKEDREQFELFLNRENNRLVESDSIFLQLNIWEDFIDAMSKTRLQDEYNKSIKQCDIFISLFFTKVGKYTAEEFEVAFKQFKATDKPIIYTYFKNSSVNMNNISRSEITSLLDFKEKISELEHFYTSYTSIDELKYHFKKQLDKILPLLK